MTADTEALRASRPSLAETTLRQLELTAWTCWASKRRNGCKAYRGNRGGGG
ncbi:hypothetical protein ACRAWD_12960 [Caulobacter segnis]